MSSLQVHQFLKTPQGHLASKPSEVIVFTSINHDLIFSHKIRLAEVLQTLKTQTYEFSM